jgi:hypothetical protein
VRLWQTDLQAVSDSAVYDRRPAATVDSAAAGSAAAGSAAAGSAAAVDSAAAGDSTGARQARRQESRFFGHPLSWSSGGAGPSQAQLSGDSLRVVGREGAVHRLDARGNAFLAQEDSLLDGRLQQLKGRRMRGYFTQDSTGGTTLRRLWAGPNAQAIYFQKKDAAADSAGSNALAGAVRVSSDSIVFRMRAGELERMRVLSGVEGTRYEAENVPDPFRLDGFVWSPARRPQKGVFLREERVRRRLTRPAPPPKRNAPPAAEPPPEEPPSATTTPTTAAGPPGDE